MDTQSIKLTINGEKYTVEIEKGWTLLYVLRETLDLTGTKGGCRTGDCGSCTVLVEGEDVLSCTVLAHTLENKSIETIEGLSRGTSLHPIQEAFVEAGAVQCGFCTPGMVMAAKALLDKQPEPSRDEIVKAIERNLCRCTGYVKIIEAVQLAAEKIRAVQS